MRRASLLGWRRVGNVWKSLRSLTLTTAGTAMFAEPMPRSKKTDEDDQIFNAPVAQLVAASHF